MHEKSKNLVKHCKHRQEDILMNWMTFAFVMTFICLPALIAFGQDIPNARIDLRAILAPTTLAWLALIPTFAF